MNEVYFTSVCSKFAVESTLYLCGSDLCHITLLLYIPVHFTILLTTLQVNEAFLTEIQPNNSICDPDLSHIICTLLAYLTSVSYYSAGEHSLHLRLLNITLLLCFTGVLYYCILLLHSWTQTTFATLTSSLLLYYCSLLVYFTSVFTTPHMNAAFRIDIQPQDYICGAELFHTTLLLYFTGVLNRCIYYSTGECVVSHWHTPQRLYLQP